MHKLFTVTSLIVALSLTAFAGKRERDLVTNEVAPAVKNAEAKFAGACGCPLAITVDEDTLKSMDELRQAKYMAGYISDGAPKYCTDAASKKAMCQLKAVIFTKAPKAEFTFKAGKGILTTTGQQNANWEMITRVLDK